jgi:translocation and assembly module TamB
MRRPAKISAWIVGSLLTVIVALVAAVWLAGNTAGGRALIERSITRFSAGHVQLSGLSGSFPAAIDLARLQLADEHGVWLTAERISLRWSPLALLARHLKIERLQFARLAIERQPVSQPSQKSSSTNVPHVDVDQVSIETLELGPELTGVRATLFVGGAAHVRSMSDAIAAVTAHRTDRGGDYEVSVRSDAARMEATVKLEEPANGALANLLKIPGIGAVSVEATLSGPRSAEGVQLNARLGELHALAQGSLDLTHGTANLVYRVEAPAMAPRPDFAWKSLALQGRWQGSNRAPRAEAQLRIDRLQIPGGGGLGTLDANLNADGHELTAHAVADGVLLPGPQPRLLADAPLRVDAATRLGDASKPVRLSAKHRLFSLQAEANTGEALHATFALRLPDLGPFGALAGEKVSGSTELKGTLEGSSANARLDLDANAELAKGDTLITSLLSGSSHLQLRGVLTEKSVEIERLALNGRNLSVSASGSAERGTAEDKSAIRSLRAHYEASVADLSVLSSAVGGTLKLTGDAKGPFSSLATELQLTSSVSIRGAPAETIQASLKARGLPSLPSATLQAQGGLAGAPLQLDASLERTAGDLFHLVVHRVEWKSARVDGDLTTGAHMTAGHGGLRLSMERLEDLQPLLGMPLKGSIEGSLALRPVAGRTLTQLHVDARNIVAADVPANGQLTLSGPFDAMALKVNVQSPNLRGEAASLDTAARLNLTARELQLQHVEAHYHGQTLRLLAPAQVAFADGLAITRLKLGMQKAVIELDGRVSPALNLHAAAHQIDAALINTFMPDVLAQGSFDADARLTGSTSAPSGLVTLNAVGLRASAAQEVQAIDVHATTRLAGNSAQLDVRLDAGRDSQLALTGTAPLDARGSLDLKVSGKVQAAVVNPILEARGDRLTGLLTVNATVKGALGTPDIAGTVDLANGDLRDYVQGAHLSNITAHLTGKEGTLTIESLTAHAGPGQIAVKGQIGVMQAKLPITLELTARNAQPVASDILTAKFDADLKVAGTLRERIDLTGTINLGRSVIGIPNAMPPEVSVLNVRRPGEAPPPPPERKLIIGLDLKLHAPREILVQGRGLNAELGGDLHITGTTASPTVRGGFEMIRGTFTLASTRLNFKSGRVSFSGASLSGKIDPSLDFLAEAAVSDGTAKLHITGLADSPQFELSSEPSLPQDEILALLLFGQRASQLSALQLAQIGAALASLSGVGGSGPNPLAKVQKSLGLDVLSVGSSNTGTGTQSTGTTVEAGRYVSNRVFVAAKQSTTGFTQMEVDVDLSKHLKLQTRLGNGTAPTQGTTPENDPGSSVGMVYQFQY